MSVRFDAAADRLLRTTGLFDDSNPYTISVWVYPIASTGIRVIFSTSRNDINSGSEHDVFSVNNAGNAEIRTNGTNVSGSAVSASNWHHYGVIRNSDTDITCWLNGVNDFTNTTSITSRTNNATRQEWSAAETGDRFPLDGRVAYIKIWTVALSAAEILQEMESIRPIRLADLYGFWPTFFGTSERLRDYSGNGRDWIESGSLTDEAPPPVSWGSLPLVVVGQPSGGTTFEQSVAGSVTPSGAISKEVQISPFGSISPAGLLAEESQKNLSGSLTPVGSLSKETQKTPTGSVTPSGSLSTSLIQFQSLAGSVSPTGSLLKLAQKTMSGALAPIGALLAQAQKALSGSLTPSGLLSKESQKSPVGSILPSGSLSKAVQKSLSGSIPLSGLLDASDPNKIFEIRHENNDLSEYTSTVTDLGDLSTSAAAALGGTNFGLSALVDDTTSIYGQKDFTQLTSSAYRWRFYFDPNGISMPNFSLELCVILQNNSKRARVQLRQVAGVYEIRAEFTDDTFTDHQTAWYSISDAPHYIEALVEYASSGVASDATLTLWIDGTQKEQVSGIDVFDISKPDEARLGAMSVGGGSGTIYLDEFCFRDDDEEIGAAGLTQSVAGSISPSGNLVRLINKVLAGSIAPSAIAGRLFEIELSGSVTPGGAISKQVNKVLAGSVTPVGVLTTIFVPSLTTSQKTLAGVPVVTLSIGGHTLDAYVVGYKYEEAAEESGSLAIWLDNRDGNFDDLGTDWPSLTRGTAVDLRRGLSINGASSTEKLPVCWVDSMQYLQDDGAGLLLLDCVDWLGRLENFRFAAKQTYTSQDVRDIAANILTQVGLTLQAGTFAYTITHEIDVTEDGDEALKDVMKRVTEFLYTTTDSSILYKELDSAEAAGYDYDFSDGGGANHPLLPESEIAESSAEFNKVTVQNDSFSGSAEDTVESALVGTRLNTIEDETLTSNAQCAERAAAELSFWQAKKTAGTLVARPHFTLRLYDVVSVAAPPWGGPAIATARVTAIRESYGFNEWEQEITIGDLPERALVHIEERPGRGAGSRTSGGGRRRRGSSARRKTSRRRSSSSRRSSTGRRQYSYRSHTHGAGSIASGAVGSSELADGSVTNAKLATDSVSFSKMQSNSVGNSEMRFDAIDTDEIVDGAVTSAKLAALSIDTAQIADGAVTQDKLATDSVSNSKMRNLSVDTPELVDQSVTQDKLATDSVSNSKMRNLSVGTNELIDASVTNVKLATNAVTNSKMANNSVDTAEIVDGAVTNAKLATDAVTAAKIAANAVGSSEIAAGAVGNSEIATNAVDTAEIVNEAVIDAKMAADAVGTGTIRDNAVTCAKLSAALQTLIGCTP